MKRIAPHRRVARSNASPAAALGDLAAPRLVAAFPAPAGIVRARGGFTLMELLVVIGILVLIMAIALPALVSMRRSGQKTRAAADLQAIAFALDAYKTDFGDYPRPELNVGFATLGHTLYSPGGPAPDTVPASFEPGDVTLYNGTEFVAVRTGSGQNPGSPSQYWQAFPYADGAPGPGFRVRPGLGGRVYPPYLQAGKFRLRGQAILDLFGNPILYCPASARRVNTQEPGGFWYVDDYAFAPPATRPPPVFEAGENLNFFMRANETNSNDPAVRERALKRMAAFLVRDFDLVATKAGGTLGKTTGTQKPNTMGPYLLWSAGADGFYGVTHDVNDGMKKQDIDKCDDVVNFERQ